MSSILLYYTFIIFYIVWHIIFILHGIAIDWLVVGVQSLVFFFFCCIVIIIYLLVFFPSKPICNDVSSLDDHTSFAFHIHNP